jgi:hypothetical protein
VVFPIKDMDGMVPQLCTQKNKQKVGKKLYQQFMPKVVKSFFKCGIWVDKVILHTIKIKI